MIRVSELKLPVTGNQRALEKKLAKALRVPVEEIKAYRIFKRSLDARKKPALFYSYSVNVTVKKEEKVYKDACRRLGKANVLLTEKTEYLFPAEGSTQQKHPTVIIGMGPAGLFCGYYLAQHGYHSGTGCRRGCQTGGCRSFLADGQIKAGFQCAVWRRRCRNFFGW